MAFDRNGGPGGAARRLPRRITCAAGGRQLVANGDFEWSAPWPGQDGRRNRVGAAWWLAKPPKTIPRPYNCVGGTDDGCFWAVPEFGDVQKMAFAYRVHGGLQAQKYFTYGRMHWAGLSQKVDNFNPGARLRFSDLHAGVDVLSVYRRLPVWQGL